MRRAIAERSERLADLCCRYGVQRLDLFGSATRTDFDKMRSDIDLLVQFEKESPLGAFDRYMCLKEELEALFGRQVDLVEANALRNPYVKAEIMRHRELLFAA